MFCGFILVRGRSSSGCIIVFPSMMLLYKLQRNKIFGPGLIFDSRLSWDLQVSNVGKELFTSDQVV